jgi:hypothetical protein
MMSTVIRATCERCGDIRLPASEFIVRVREGMTDGEYRFKCKCGFIVLKYCPANIVTLLLSSGVEKETWELPLELIEHPSDDGTLSEDDLIDLGIAFEDGTAFDKITGQNE